MRSFVVVALLGAITFASAQTPTCYEGFNATIGGVPLYHWHERECNDKSECFVQELGVKIYDTGLDVVARYGGCISSSYSPLVTCDKLFGPDSDLNPATLINLVPDIGKAFEAMAADFRQKALENIRLLFSSGEGADEFIAGCYRFLENVGFNMEKAVPLQKSITEMFDSIFPRSYASNMEPFVKRQKAAVANFMETLGELDTKNPAISDAIYSFLSQPIFGGIDIRKTIWAPMIEEMPELLKSTFPASWDADSWYDAQFEILGKMNFSNPVQSAKDIVEIVKASWKLPEEVEKFIHPILNSIPGMLDQFLNGNSTLVLETLKDESFENSATKRLAQAVVNFFEMLLHQANLPKNVRTMIRWLPGIAHKLFPEKISELDRVYNVVSDALENTDISDPISTLEKTKLSEFLILIAEKTDLSKLLRLGSSPEESTQVNEMIIINTAKMVYNLIPEYSKQMDTIFSTLSEGFKNYPIFYPGVIITNLIVNLGAEVPKEIEPILNNLQSVLDTIYNETGLNFKSEEFFTELKKIADAYQSLYPESEFPKIAIGYVDYVNKSVNGLPRYDCRYDFNADWSVYEQCMNEYSAKTSTFARELLKEQIDLQVDLQFAIFKAMDNVEYPIMKAFHDAFPDYELLLKGMRLLEPSDVKELMNDYVNWMYDSIEARQPMTVEGFVKAVNATLIRITAKLESVVKELRSLVEPDTCRYLSCGDNFCNTQEAMDSVEPSKRDPDKRRFGERVETEPHISTTTPSGGAERPSSTLLLNLLAAWVLAKLAM